MILSNDSPSVITIEYLEKSYIDALANTESAGDLMGDKVFDALIYVCEKAEKNILDAADLKTLRGYISQKLFNEIEKYSPDQACADSLAFSQKADAFFYCYKLFLGIKPEDFQDKWIYEKILMAKNRAKERQDFSFVPEIIVSFTSFPARIGTIYKTLASVYSQTIKPDRVILWLAESQFPNRYEDLPQSLLAYTKYGLEIRWCIEDIRPHKKYYYAMKEFRRAIIITIDDDIIYDRYMLETLLASYLHFPDAVSALRTHLILADENGNVLPYRQWKHEFSGVIGKPSMQLLATGCAGILYPPGCIDIDCFTLEDINRLALNADDLWLKIMQVKKGTPVVLAQENQPLVFVPDSQEVALYKTNSHGNENDVQLENILNRYDENGNIVNAIFSDGYTAKTVLKGLKVTEDNNFLLLNNVVTEHLKARYSDVYATKENINKEKAALTKQLSAETDRADKLNKYLSDIKNSVSFKIGRVITWLPRYIKNSIKRK